MVEERLELWGSTFGVLEAKVTAKHKSVCQDYSLVSQNFKDGNLLSCFLSVADGHGSKSCPRSDRGSKIACEEAEKALIELETIFQLKTEEDQLKFKTKLINNWREAVRQDFENSPLSEEEKAGLKAAHLKALENTEDIEIKNGAIHLLYGTTLVAVAICEQGCAYLQIGDGNILQLNADLKVEQIFPDATGLIGTESYSFAMSIPEKHMQLKIHFKEQQLETTSNPLAIQLSTDGYANSFSGQEGFRKTISDYYQILNQVALEKVKEALPIWLQESSDKGSGDDVTLVGIYKINPAQDKEIATQEPKSNEITIYEPLFSESEAFEIQKVDEGLGNLEDSTVFNNTAELPSLPQAEITEKETLEDTPSENEETKNN